MVPVPVPVALQVVPVAPEHVQVDPVARAPVVPVARVPAALPVVLVVRVALVPAVLPDPVVVRDPVADPAVVPVVVRAPVVAVATARTASVVHRAKSRVPVVAGTWRSCNPTS